MIKVIDNYLPKEYVDYIEKLFLKPEINNGSDIAWFYYDYTTSKDADYLKKIKDNKHFYDSYQFTHYTFNIKFITTLFSDLIGLIKL